ncbi:glycosyltransferase family 4 protein [Flavobacterium sp. RSP29]|uniref:glycosyltransferase family 4 protein n=1 Tax=Flavobacterium sp. RSP29 TaxID=3401731 RepID=UPI003AAF560A
MRIVFSTDQIYLHGGIEKVMTEKANYFTDVLGYEVFILTTEQKEKKPCYTLSSKIELTDLDINYIRDKSYFHPNNLVKIPHHFRQWKKAIKNINPDFIIVCNYAFDFYWTPFCLIKIHKLKEFHSSKYFVERARKKDYIFKKWNRSLDDFIESKYTRLIVLNEDEKEFYKSKNIEIIPNPVTVPKDIQAKLQNKKAIAAGRIAPVKGYENAIRAWKEIASQETDWELHIFGQGEPEYVAQLQDLIRISNLEKNVFIKKAVEDLQHRMTDYSLYIMTSHTECFPMVLLESLAIGLPIVSFDCPTGPRNIITNNEDGFLVENQSVKKLVVKILLLIKNEELRIEMGYKAKKNANRFATDRVMSKWKELLIDLKKYD